MMNGMLSDPPSHKFGHAQQHTLTKCNMCGCPEQAWKAQVTGISVPDTHSPHSCYTAFFLPPIVSLEVPHDQVIGEEKFRPGLQMVLHNMQVHSRA